MSAYPGLGGALNGTPRYFLFFGFSSYYDFAQFSAGDRFDESLGQEEWCYAVKNMFTLFETILLDAERLERRLCDLENCVVVSFNSFLDCVSVVM